MRYDKSSKNSKSSSFMLKSMLFGLLSGLLVCTVFLILFSFVFVKIGAMPYNIVQLLAMLSSALGSFTAGYTTLKIQREKGLYLGALSGLMLFCVFTLTGFIVSREGFTYLTIVKLILLVFTGALGGIISANRKK